MDGQAITTFALSRVPALVDATLADAAVSKDDVRWFLFHQANAFMNGRLRSALRIPPEKSPMCIEKYGNTVSNTLPVLLQNQAASFQPSDRMILVGFGVGYSWGAMMMRWGNVQIV
jgi:3-oxoacyl-[acyl-carrier-protein] synthase-3